MDVQITPEMTALQERLGYWWADPALLREALTHSSYGNPRGEPHSERLEFLGDSVIDLVTAEWLSMRFPQADEGFMAQTREGLVRESALAELSKTLEIGGSLIVEPNASYLRCVDSVLADAFEAVIGALYRDSACLHHVRQVLLRCGFFS